jgi:hypothetical protein
MSLLTPSHDVWLAILDLISDEDRSQSKACNLVCRDWHKHLRPRLMASVLLCGSDHRASAQDLQVLQQSDLNHLTRRLCLEQWNETRLPSGSSLVLNALSFFSALVTLELRDVLFPTFTDLQVCLARTSFSLKHLIILSCACLDARSMKKLVEKGYISDYPVYQPHGLALERVDVDSEQSESMASLLWPWFALSPTVSAIRSLHVRFDYFSRLDLPILYEFLSHSQCSVEELKLALNTPITRFDPAGMSTRIFVRFDRCDMWSLT